MRISMLRGLTLLASVAFAISAVQAEDGARTETWRQSEISNWQLAKDKMEAVEAAGRAWCQGDGDADAIKAALKKFGDDDRIYLVICERKRQDKHGTEKHTIVGSNEDRMGRIASLNVTNDDTPGIHMEYATVENNTVNVVCAVKHILAKEGDPLNTGGSITVIIRAEDDLRFKKAKDVLLKLSIEESERSKK